MFSATSSAASSSGSTSSAASPSNKGALLLEVRQLGNRSHPLTVAVSQLKGAEVAETWVERFLPPAQLVGAVNLRELKAQVLTEENPLFLPIHQLMQKARTNLMPQLANKDPLQQIFQIYESFIGEVCATQGKERSRLLKGDILLEEHAIGQVFIPQEVGRALTSYGKYGELVKSNALGSSAVQKVGEIYYKRERFNPLAPGNEALFNSFSSFFSDRGSPPTLLLKLRNIYAKVPLNENSRNHPGRRIVEEALFAGESLGEIFRRLPDLRSSYPFDIERRSVVIQASKAFEGRNLHDFIYEDEPCSIDPTSFTLQVMLALLFRLSDARADNYIVSDDRFLSLIDADPLFDPPITWNNECHLIKLRSILFLLPDMNHPISAPAKTLILGVLSDLDQLLIDWAAAIQKRNGDYVEQLKAGFLHAEEMENLSLPITLSYSHFMTLYRQLHTIRSLLSDAETITHWDLFSSLYPTLSRAYQQLAKTEKPLSAQQRLFSRTFLSLEEVLGNVEEPLVQEELTPLLPIPELMQKWLEEPSDRTAKEERRLMEQVLPLTGQQPLLLKRSALDDRDLHYLVSRFKLQQLLFDQTPNITSRGLVDLLSEHPSLQITVGTMAHFGMDHWLKLFDLHFSLKRIGHLFIEGEAVLLTADCSLFSKLLYAQRWTELEALIKLGFSCTSEQLGQDFLHRLAEQPFPEAISFLVNHDYPTDLRNNRGQTPLHLAAQAGQIVNFAPLLSRDPEVINDRDMEGRTPLLLAAIRGHQDAVEKLLELKANPFLTSKEKENALHYAAFYGHSALLNVLLQTDLKAVIDTGDSDGKTPLHRAVWLNPKPEVVHLLLNAGATVDQRNLFDYTPLHWAAKNGHLTSARMLLERGADFTLENQNGHTPLDIAVSFGQDSIVRLFLNPEAVDVSNSASSAVAATSDPEGSLYREFEEAYDTNRPFDQIVALEKLADINLQNEDFVRTSHLLNSALAVAQKRNINPHYQHYLFHRLESLEGRFLEKTFGVKTPASHRNYLVPYRDRLKALREEVCRRVELGQEPVETTLEFLTQGFNRLLCDLIDESLRLIDKAPPTSFAMITLGSLARHEPSLYSDVEFAILTAEDSPAIKTYFRNLSALLELKIGNFGETKFEIIRPRRVEGVMQEAQSLTRNGFSMDIGGLSPRGKAGVYELIATPTQMASFQDPSWLQRHDGELILVNALSSVSHLYGDEALVNAYRQEMNRYLDVKTDTILRFFGGTKEREKRAISILQGHVSEFRPYLEIDRLEMRAFDVKKDLYRPIQMMMHALMLYHDINRQSILQGIEALRAKKIISAEGAQHLASALRQTLQLRLKAHAYYQTEKEILYFKRGAEDTEGVGLFHINHPTLILKLYRVLTPLHSEMVEFVRNPKRTLQTNQFYDTAFGKLNTQAEEELNYTVATSSYVQAAALNPEDDVALGRLGRIKQELGEAQEAIKHYQEELRILKGKHGDKPHPDVANSLNNQGNAYLSLGKTARAIEYHEQSLAMRKLIYEGKPHPNVAVSLNNLGMVYLSLSEMNRAIDYFEQSLAMRKLIYGHKPHPDVASSLNNLGMAYQSLSETVRAIEYHEQSLGMRKLIYGDKPHPNVAMSFNNLGNAYYKLGETARAIKYHEQSLAISKLIYGDRPHPNVAHSLNNLGLTYDDLGETTRAIEYYKQSIAMKKFIYGDKPHPNVASSLNNLGVTYQSLGETARAIDYYEQSLAMDKLIYGDKPHPDVAMSLNNLGIVYASLGETARAIEYHEQSLAMRKLIYGDKPHPDVANSLNNLGMAYQSLSETARAIEYHEQSLAMRKLIYEDKPHPRIAASLYNLGLVYEKLTDYPKAHEAYQKAYTIYRILKGDDHKDTKETLTKLQRLEAALAALT